MFERLKKFFRKEEISEKAIIHSSKGEYTQGYRLKGGGHGQEAMDYMDQHGIKYNVVKTYRNGVRLGNVPRHKDIYKQTGTGQCWFPRNWDRKKIKKAGQAVAKGKKYPNGKTKVKKVFGVKVGIKRTYGKISTIFPLYEQTKRRR